MGTLEFNSQFIDLQPKLMPTAYRLTHNYEDARDLIQETAMRAFKNKEKFEMGTNFHAWVVTIMRNTFINIYRKKKNRATSCEPTGSYVFETGTTAQENGALSNLMMEELKSIIYELSETYSRPFLLYYEGFKYEEIAADMDLPVGTVKSRIFFARKKIRELIEMRYPKSLVA
jgi:RNA polymerase sigma-70 factor (ECF subfamily)